MIPPAPSCDYACFASGMAETVADVFGTYLHVSLSFSAVSLFGRVSLSLGSFLTAAPSAVGGGRR